MKNNKLPLKERYNNFIQEHPKFWLTLIYCGLMLFLAVAMFIAALNPPDNEAASADYRATGACPIQTYNNHIAISTSNLGISFEDAYEIISSIDDADFFIYPCAASFEVIGSGGPRLLAYRYITFFKIAATLPDGTVIKSGDIYFSNSQNDPRDQPYPTDRISLIKHTSDHSPNYIEDAHYVILNTLYLPDGFINKIFPAMDLALLSDLVGENGCWVPNSGSCSPDDLKAEYDNGYNEGYDKGHTDGYQTGYNKGKLDGTTVDLNPISIFLEPVSAFMNIKLFGFVSLGLVFNIVLFVSLAIIFIKLFAGG